MLWLLKKRIFYGHDMKLPFQMQSFEWVKNLRLYKFCGPITQHLYTNTQQGYHFRTLFVGVKHGPLWATNHSLHSGNRSGIFLKSYWTLYWTNLTLKGKNKVISFILLFEKVDTIKINAIFALHTRDRSSTCIIIFWWCSILWVNSSSFVWRQSS